MASIYKRGRTWYSSISIGGSQVRKPLSTDRKIAEVKLAELIKDRDSKRHAHHFHGLTWQGLKEKYLEYCRGHKSPRTVLRDEAALSSLEKFYLPQAPEEVTSELLERWVGSRRQAGRGPATINRDLNAIKAMLHKAMSWGYLPKKEIKVAKLKQARGRLIFHSAAQLKHLLTLCRITHPEKSLNVIPHDWTTICLLGSRAGLRLSEMLHLGWEDIRSDHLSVTPKVCGCGDCEHRQGRWEPKDYEQRHVPLADDLKAHLKRLPRTTHWVLGQRPKASVVSAYFRKITRKAGLKGSVHTLRHTFASHLAQAGVSLYTISKLLGHSDIKTTQIYAHLCKDSFGDAIHKLPRIVQRL